MTRVVDRLIAGAAALVLAALLGTVVIGVVTRGLGDPVVWSDELARYLMVWLAFLGWILATRRRNHIRISVLLERLPAPAARGAEVLIQLAIAGFGVALIVHGVTLIERNLDVEAISMEVPQALLYALLPVAGVAITIQALIQAVEAATGRTAPQIHSGEAL